VYTDDVHIEPNTLNGIRQLLFTLVAVVLYSLHMTPIQVNNADVFCPTGKSILNQFADSIFVAKTILLLLLPG
jgi:hypothetical protein